MIDHSRRAAEAHTRLVRALAAFTGRDPREYTALVGDDGCVGVVSTVTVTVTVFYPVDAWTSKFVRQLHAGVFDVEDRAAPFW